MQQAYFNSGIVLRRMKKLEQAIERFDHAISLNPHDVNANVFKEGYWSQNGASLGIEVDTESAELASTVRAIALRLEGALRTAKKAHLQTSEVLLPPDLLTRISRDIVRMSETEPCGLRGCLILLDFESGHSSSSSSSSPPNQSTNHNNNNTITTNNNNNNAGLNHQLDSSCNKRKIGKVKCDSTTVTTFELHLSLREDLAPWYSRLPQILRNLTKGGTIVVSPAYSISKKKLYRSH